MKVGIAATLGFYLQPGVIVTAIEYVVLGGVVFGTSVALPVFVVGTGGVFVAASVYHAYVAAKRGATRALVNTLGQNNITINSTNVINNEPCCIDATPH